MPCHSLSHITKLSACSFVFETIMATKVGSIAAKECTDFAPQSAIVVISHMTDWEVIDISSVSDKIKNST